MLISHDLYSHALTALIVKSSNTVHPLDVANNLSHEDRGNGVNKNAK